MNYSALDDTQIMRMVAAGHEEALAALYDRFGRLIYSMAYNVLGDGALAEEVTQDVFVRVWEKAEQYQETQGRLANWLSSLARNRAIDVYRRMRVRPEGNLAGFAVEDAVNLRDGHNVEGAVEALDQRARMHRALALLPKEQRVALAYAYFQGYSHAEIASELGEPLGTIKTRIRLAMLKLRDLLKEDAPDLHLGLDDASIDNHRQGRSNSSTRNVNKSESVD